MKRKNIVLLIITAIIAVCIYGLFEIPEKVVQKPVRKTEVKAIANKSDSIAESYYHEIERLLRENDSLYYQIRQVKGELMKVKQKAIGSEEKVKKYSAEVKTQTDTIQKLVYCDSLRVEVDSLMETVNIKDRLYEEVVGNLTTMVQNKDSIIWSCEDKGEQLKTLLDTSLKQQEELISQVERLEKKIKKKERRWRWVSGSIAFISTVTTAVLMKR